MPITRHNFTPFIPQDKALEHSSVPDKAMLLSSSAARLTGCISVDTQKTLIEYMLVINSYYSNLIEGNHTEPYEIRAAQRGEFASETKKRDLQLESIAHIKVQKWLGEQSIDVDVLFSVDFIKSIHREFYKHIPKSLYEIKNQFDVVKDILLAGEWRSKKVIVGRYIPPEPEYLNSLMSGFCDIYNPDKYRGEKKIIAILCAHHRFSWIHPFADGNGRVVRLFTDCALKMIGIESVGVWCLSRGLARASSRYKNMLEHADNSRQSDFDGRGLLSESALINFCEFMLDTSLDQINYINDLLQLEQMHSRISSYVQARNDGRVKGVAKIKEVAALILYNAFVHGKLERKMAFELCGMPDRTARKLLAQLKEDGLLSETSSRSPFYWQIPEHAEPWYFPQLTPGL